MLNRADPFVEVSVMESGEHVLGAAGEVHLETCIKDLRMRFARVELQVSTLRASVRALHVKGLHTPFVRVELWVRRRWLRASSCELATPDHCGDCSCNCCCCCWLYK